MADDNAMLQACYGENTHVPWFFQLAWQMLDERELLAERVSDQAAREIYYRVKGQPFNTAPRSQLSFLGSASPFGESNIYSWDDDYYSYLDRHDHDFAGETVGGVVRGLSLVRSQIGGWVDANEAVAHLSWNMSFKIENGAGKEIRAQILLPPHAVVTGCSLWINGIKHDSVIATRESSREAYSISANSGEKPLLVSTAGAGRVLVQSSTGFWGTGANLVLEITSPLVLLGPGKAALPLPLFTERNFGVSAEHEVALKSRTPLLPATRLRQQHQSRSQVSSDQTQILVDGTISNAELNNGNGALLFLRDPSITELVAPDLDDKAQNVEQRIVSRTLSPETPAVIVVDGSSAMAGEMSGICDVLREVRLKDASILWASDRPLIVASHVSTDSLAWSRALDRLRDSSCLGGQNNAEALSHAITDFGKQSDLNIIWLHAGQPVKFSGDSLLKLIEGTHHRLNLYEYQVAPGPNEVIKSLDQTTALIQIPRLSTVSQDLSSLFDRLSGKAITYDIERSFVAPSNTPAPLAKHASEVAQLYVSNLVFSNVSNRAERRKYGALAESHRLVTPLTSALVLENEANYDRYGVQKYAKSNHSTGGNKMAALGPMTNFIPAKPEPPMSLIMVCALFVMGIFFGIMRRRNQTS
jgi:hypothetical protein